MYSTCDIPSPVNVVFYALPGWVQQFKNYSLQQMGLG